MKKHVFINWLLVFAAISVGAQQNDFPKLRGPYLGQKPPGRTAEPFGPSINKEGEYNYSPFIAPEGSYLVFARSQQPPKLYISYWKKDGTWTPAKDISGIIKSDVCQNPFVASDGKFLFFTIGGRIHWVDAGFIEELKPTSENSLTKSGETPEGQAPKLNEKLSVFKPFIGPTWVGSIPNDSRMGEMTLKWEIVLNGFAVKLKRNILKFDHWLETTYFWDESSEKIAYLALSNNGVVIKGYVAGQGEELISEGDQRGPDVNRKVRRIYRLEKDGKLYEDDQFRNSDTDEWRRTHVSVFVAK